MEKTRHYTPTLYIGIGGTGYHTLSLIKKCFENEFGPGNVPGYIRFLAIDTDIHSNDDLEEDFFFIFPETISPAEYIDYHVRNRTGQCDWYISDNRDFPKKGYGAASDRANGRLLMEMDGLRLQARLRLILSEMIDAAASSDKIDVRMVMSLAGGTGSGIFIPLALMLHQYHVVDMYGYAQMHGFFRRALPYSPVYKNAFINTYSAVLEMDYIQNASFLSQVRLSFAGRVYNISDSLFKEFYLIENITDAGYVVEEHNDLLQSLSMAMYTSALLDTGNNLGFMIRSGNYDIENKKGWLGSVGACEVIYKGKILAELYSHMAAYKIVSAFQELGQDSDCKAYGFWMSTFLRCTGLSLNDTMSGSHLKTVEPLKIRDSDHVNTEVSSYLECLPIESDNRVLEEVSALLEDSVYRIENGFSGASVFLTDLKDICENKIKEIENELLRIEESVKVEQSSLETALSDFEKENSRFFVYKSRIRGWIDSIEDKAFSLACMLVERNARKESVSILKLLIAQICQHEERLNSASKEMIRMGYSLRNRISELEAICFDSSEFSYNLSAVDLDGIRGMKECFLDDFCSKHNRLRLDDKWLIDEIMSYVEDLPSASKYRTKTISEIIDSMSDTQYDVLKQFIRKHAIRMLMLNWRGLSSGNIYTSRFLTVSIYGTEKTRLENEIDQFWIMWDLADTKVHWNKSFDERMRQRMIVSLAEGGFIPYCIEAFTHELVQKEYVDVIKTGYNPHIDAVMYADMQKSGFTLTPTIPPLAPDENEVIHNEMCGNQEMVKESGPESSPLPEHKSIPRSGKKKYDVFISSKSEDYVYAEQIYNFLIANGLSVFLACRELKRIGEDEYALAIDNALDETEHMIVVTSSAQYVRTKWVRYEWSTFENDKKSGYREGNLLVVRLPEVEQKDLPPGLRHKEFFLFDTYQDSILYYLH